MEILKGTVKEQGYPPVPDVYYGKVDEKTIYYFIPDGKMANGNIIVSTNLKEAVGHAPHTSLGYIDPKGNVLIPCENKTLKQVGNKEDNILLAEKSTPTSESVTAIIKSISNPANQQAIEENSKRIKDQMIQAMGMSGDFIFDNQCSEAALYTMDGLNVSNGYYSFISELNSNYYFATNVPGQQIFTFNPSMLQQQAPEQEQIEQEAMPNIDIPIQQQLENNEVVNQQGIDMPPQVEPEAREQIQQSADIEKLEQVNTPSVNNSEAEERLDQIMGFANKESNDSSSQEVSMSEETNESGKEFETEIAEEDEITAEDQEDEIKAEAEEDEVTAEDQEDEIEAEAEEDEVTAENQEDEIEAEAEENKIKSKNEEQEKIIDFPNIYKLDDEDISTPVIRDATQTIINIVGENRKLRQELDKRDGKISILESNLEILNEDVRAKDEENKSLRQELAKEREEKALYKNKAAESNREAIKSKVALERKNDIINDKDKQINGLLGQVAGLSNLNNAVMEANALVQPAENNSGDNVIYGDFTYLGNAKSKSKVA